MTILSDFIAKKKQKNAFLLFFLDFYCLSMAKQMYFIVIYIA